MPKLPNVAFDILLDELSKIISSGRSKSEADTTLPDIPHVEYQYVIPTYRAMEQITQFYEFFAPRLQTFFNAFLQEPDRGDAILTLLRDRALQARIATVKTSLPKHPDRRVVEYDSHGVRHTRRVRLNPITGRIQ